MFHIKCNFVFLYVFIRFSYIFKHNFHFALIFSSLVNKFKQNIIGVFNKDKTKIIHFLNLYEKTLMTNVVSI